MSNQENQTQKPYTVLDIMNTVYNIAVKCEGGSGQKVRELRNQLATTITCDEVDTPHNVSVQIGDTTHNVPIYFGALLARVLKDNPVETLFYLKGLYLGKFQFENRDKVFGTTVVPTNSPLLPVIDYLKKVVGETYPAALPLDIGTRDNSLYCTIPEDLSLIARLACDFDESGADYSALKQFNAPAIRKAARIMLPSDGIPALLSSMVVTETKGKKADEGYIKLTFTLPQAESDTTSDNDGTTE